MSGYFQDLHFAFRQFHRRRAFHWLRSWCWAWELGVNTAIFSVVNALFLRPLPYRDTNGIACSYMSAI